MQNHLQIIGIQSDLVWENPTTNRNSFEQKIKAMSSKIDLIVLPEMFTTGFTMNVQAIAESMEGATLSWMKKMASEKNCAITGSLVIQEKEQFYNRMVFVYPSQKVEFYDKKHLFTLANEQKTFTAGTSIQPILYKGWKICPLICYDLRFPVWSRNTIEYDLLLYVASWPIPRINAWTTLLKARAIENMSYVMGINRIGTDINGHQYSGNSILLDCFGSELSALKDNQEGCIEAVLDKDKQEVSRNKFSFLEDRDLFELKF